MDDAVSARADYARLLGEVQAGNRHAEGELLARLQRPLKVVLRHRTGNPQAADDLCQEALIVVLRAAREGSVRDPEALVEFALGTARRLVQNASRKAARQNTWNDDELIEDMESETPSATASIEAQELGQRVARVLAEMSSERDRQVLCAYYLQERESTDLQAAHQLDSLQLARILHRARKRFATLWKRRYRNEGEPV
ncbi:MAG: sigma-70 family RNA polymerase sigma factor [Lysobacteraceae bacterium]